MEKMTFYQWINCEYGIVKREYKELRDDLKMQLKMEYDKYLAEE